MNRITFSLLAIMSGLLSAIPDAIADDNNHLTEAHATKLLNELKPDKSALWRTIPWKIDLLDAQQRASRERKPIFIWAMDGHPLGCT